QAIYDYTLPQVGINTPVDYNNVPVFFCNYWMIRTNWMIKYVNFAVKYMEKLDDVNDLYLQKLLYANANYEGRLPAERLIQISGFPYYTHHCFVMERLPSIFAWLNSLHTH